MPTEFIVPLVMSIIGLITTFFKTFKFVQEGEEGCKLVFGKVKRDMQGNPIIIQPGFVLLLPWVETLKRRHVRQQTQQFTAQKIFIQNDLVFIVSAIVRFRVVDIYKALFEVDDLDQCVSDRCMGLMRDILQTKSSDAIRDTEGISKELLTRMKDMEDEWGVEFLDARLTSCAPSSNSEQILGVRRSAELRAQAAKEAAATLAVDPTACQGLLSAVVGISVVSNASMTKTPEQVIVKQNGKKEPSFLERLEETLEE